MVRESSRVAAWRLGRVASTEDSRRISFTFVLTVRHRCLSLLVAGGKGNANLGYR
ncbi:hypothetical protein ACLK19_06020 [Escherichia coli]